MGTRIDTTTRNAIVDAVVAKLDAAATSAKAKVYSGAQPADPATAATGTLLATVDLGDPSFPAATNGATSTDPAQVNAAATGTAGYVRLEDGDGNGRIDLVAGVSVTATATAATDVLTTSTAHGLAVGAYVYFTAGIGGLAAGKYVVIETATATTFKVAVPGSSTAVDLTDAGSATFSTAAAAFSSLALISGNPVDFQNIAISIVAGV